jgi:hypothetical protein
MVVGVILGVDGFRATWEKWKGGREEEGD